MGKLSSNPSLAPETIEGSSGVIGPRTSGWKINNIEFYNFPENTSVLQTCSHCDHTKLYTNVANEYLIENLTLTNITASQAIFWNGMRREIIYDLDGTLSNHLTGSQKPKGTLVYNYPHLNQDQACELNSAQWNGTLYCDETAIVRSVMITNLLDFKLFERSPMKVKLLSSVDEVVPENATGYTEITSLKGKLEPFNNKKYAYALPYISGRIYNIWWLTGLDFSHLAIDISKFFVDQDPAIIFKFNHTERRELFELGHLVNLQIEGNYTAINTEPLDLASCEYGEYTHDANSKILTVCLSSRNQIRPYQYLDVNAIRCRYLCPKDDDSEF